MKKLFYTGVIALGLGLMSFTNKTTEVKKEVFEPTVENGMCASMSEYEFKKVLNNTGNVEAAHAASIKTYNVCVIVHEFHNNGFWFPGLFL